MLLKHRVRPCVCTWAGGKDMGQFYVGSQSAANRCREALESKQRITITGQTADGGIQAFTGTIRSVEEDEQRLRPPWQRWRITIDDRAV